MNVKTKGATKHFRKIGLSGTELGKAMNRWEITQERLRKVKAND